MSLGRGDRQDVLYLTVDHGQVFNVLKGVRHNRQRSPGNRHRHVPERARRLPPASMSSIFLTANGRRACTSRRIPLARTDDPSVAVGVSPHCSNSFVAISIFRRLGMDLKQASQAAGSRIAGSAFVGLRRLDSSVSWNRFSTSDMRRIAAASLGPEADRPLSIRQLPWR